ncbi:MAG: anthranilate phosphoribosyltransferase, partial [bacterium]|nr:anthranilate phosphoribosyltransferase [bacterium]
MYKAIIKKLQEQQPLSPAEVEFFLDQTESGKLTSVEQSAILSMLQCKGVTATELGAFVRHFQNQREEVIPFPEAIDVCGTGGSGMNRINTSTLSAFILSALGVPVAKHGNKAASGRFGSFDLLEKLGVNIEPSGKTLVQLAKQLNLCFLYARRHYPVMRHFAPVRSEMGFPTVFNLLGPLLNPSQVKTQIIGTTSKHQMPLIAATCKKLSKKQVMVVCGKDGLDEVTLTGATFVTELSEGRIRSYTISPHSFGVGTASPEDIVGGDARQNTKIA